MENNSETPSVLADPLIFNFGIALVMLKQGRLVTRSGWNGKGMFIFHRPGVNLTIFEVLKAITVPEAVKKYFDQKHQPAKKFWADNQPIISFTSYLCMKAADDTIVNGWLASQTDMLAEDWMEFKLP